MECPLVPGMSGVLIEDTTFRCTDDSQCTAAGAWQLPCADLQHGIGVAGAGGGALTVVRTLGCGVFDQDAGNTRMAITKTAARDHGTAHDDAPEGEVLSAMGRAWVVAFVCAAQYARVVGRPWFGRSA